MLALGLLATAWRAARKGKRRLHRNIMLLLTAAAWVFLLIYLARYRYPELVPVIPKAYIPWIALHGTVALFPLIGATLLVFNRLREQHTPEKNHHLNRHHAIYGRILIFLWCFTHLGGLVNAYLFF